MSNIWAFAQAERRLTRRLARYWTFLVVAYLVTLFFYLNFTLTHAFGSSLSGTIALSNPHYMFGFLGVYYLAGFLLGFVFLGYDLRARDQREGIAEVLDAKPISNLELVLGRFLGLFLAAWIPMAVLALVLWALGLVLAASGSTVGEPIEPWSLVGFTLFLAVPAIAFSLALVFLVTVLVRNRLVAAVASVAILGGLVAASFLGSYRWQFFVDFLGFLQVNLPSDIVPTVAFNFSGWVQRLATLAFAGAMLVLAAAFYPRLDTGHRAMKLGAAGAALLVGFGLVTAATLVRQNAVDQLQTWRMAHQERLDHPRPDITAIRGDVQIAPGESLHAVLEIKVRAPADRSLESLLFSLNPGLTIDTVTTGSGQPLEVAHARGLLDIALPAPLAPGEPMTVAITYQGRPDVRFAYLDSAIDIDTLDGWSAQIGVLGYTKALFDHRFVTLMPGIRWLPVAGSNVARDDTRARPRDYFDLALSVEVPDQWLVAGPGRRETLSTDAGRARFRFAPRVPVPEVAVIAGRFQSFSTEVAGVTLEALLHPAHTRNIDVFDEIGDEIRGAIAGKLELAAEAGMPYPFEALTLVEVPYEVRAFEGGWRMDSAFGPPSLLIVREAQFPTARFDAAFEMGSIGDIQDDQRRAQAMRARLEEFFVNDFSGGNIFTNAARSFYFHQTSATGREALALNFALESLAALILSGRQSYFSAHVYADGMNEHITGVQIAYNNRRPRTLTVADVVLQYFASRPSVWEQALSASLVDLDPESDPGQTIDVLTLKAGAIARIIYDELGPAGSARFLGGLIETHRGTSFTADDVRDALRAKASPHFVAAFDELLYNTRLPGFIAESVDFYRIADDAAGNPRYQLLMRVRNDEPVQGSVRIAWLEQIEPGDVVDFSNLRRVTSELIPIAPESAIEYGVVLTQPPVSIYVDPSLSLNRTSFMAEYLRPREYPVPSQAPEPIEGVTVVDGRAPATGMVVVDDLDSGFEIRRVEGDGGLRLGQATADSEGVPLDQGLPLRRGPGVPANWSRGENITSWGRYRHTMAFRGPGDGSTLAAFTARIPEAGRWQLEMYAPNLALIGPLQATWGTWNLQVEGDGLDESFTYDPRSGTLGWNPVRQLDLPAGEITVLLSDETDGSLVVADAVRFVPASARQRGDEAAAVQAGAGQVE